MMNVHLHQALGRGDIECLDGAWLISETTLSIDESALSGADGGC